MARSKADLLTCMITQDFQPEHWDLTDDEKQIIQSEDITAIGNMLIEKLEKEGLQVSECYAVKHDSDNHKVWDEINKNYIITYKTNHGHWVFKFSKGKQLDAIAAAVGLAPQFVEKPQKGRFAYDNMLAYLIHIKHIDKHQYYDMEKGTTAVVTLRGTNYDKIYHERLQDWLKGRAKVQSQKAHTDIDWLEAQILSGEVTKAQIMLTDEYFNIYAHNKRRCEDAFDTYGQHKIYKTIQAMENGEFKLSVLFVTGRSHSGKSMFTDNLVRSIQEKARQELGETWSVCTCAATNPFDEFQGEEILVMDDLRGVALGASDWLKLLDPDRISTGSARYRNKKMACRTIIINSEKDVLDFFYYLKNSGGGDRSEALDQFFRRVLAKVIVYRIPDTETRRIGVGTMQEKEEYTVSKGDKELTLHHDFIGVNSPKVDLSGYMAYQDGINFLTDLVMSRNTDKVSSPVDDTVQSETAKGMQFDHGEDAIFGIPYEDYEKIGINLPTEEQKGDDTDD